jgi:multiple sugar transport system permease protein
MRVEASMQEADRKHRLPQKKSTFRWKEWRKALLFITPFGAIYLLFFIYPSLRVVQLSFTNSDITGIGEYIGFANYRRLMRDPLFWRSMWNTVYFVLLTVVPITLFGLLFALMVVRLERLKGLVLGAFFLPYILPVSVVTLIWEWMLNTNFGIINFILGARISWLNDPTLAMPSIALVTLWWTVGFPTLLFIAGLENISKTYYEAAAIDGAGSWQLFTAITWPLLWPVTSLVLTLQLITSLRIFAQVYLLTDGGPFNATIVVLQYMYRQAFQQFNSGYASAIAVVLFVVILIISYLQLKFFKGMRAW